VGIAKSRGRRCSAQGGYHQAAVHQRRAGDDGSNGSELDLGSVHEKVKLGHKMEPVEGRGPHGCFI
jgi:hypothetical protein